MVAEDSRVGVPYTGNILLTLVDSENWSLKELFVELVGGHGRPNLDRYLLELSFLSHVPPDQVHCLVRSGELQGQAEERVEGNRKLVAVGAPNL